MQKGRRKWLLWKKENPEQVRRVVAPVMARQMAALGGWPGEVLLNRGEKSKERRQLAEQICWANTVDTGTPTDQH